MESECKHSAHRGNRFLGAGDTGASESPDVGAGNPTPVLWKSSSALICRSFLQPPIRFCKVPASLASSLSITAPASIGEEPAAGAVLHASFPLSLFPFFPSSFLLFFCDRISLYHSDSPNTYYVAEGSPILTAILLPQPREYTGSLLTLDWSSSDLYMPVISLSTTFSINCLDLWFPIWEPLDMCNYLNLN